MGFGARWVRRGGRRECCRRSRKFRHAGTNGEISAIDMPQFVRIGVNVDQGLTRMVGREQSVTVRGCLAEPGADGEDEVGRLDPCDKLRIGAVAQISGPDRAIVGDGILSAKPGCDRNSMRRCKGGEVPRGVRVPPRTSDDRHRRLGGGKQGRESVHHGGVGGLRRALDAGPVHCFGGLDEHVLGQGQHNRPRPSRHGHRIGSSDIFGDSCRIVDPRGPFGERREHRCEIDFLETFAVAHAPVDIADEQDHRLRVLHRDMDADRGIRRPRPARHKGYAGPSGQCPVCTGHMSDAALLPADYGLDFGRVVKRVENGKEALSGHGEDAVAALDDELVDKDAAAGACVAHA